MSILLIHDKDTQLAVPKDQEVAAAHGDSGALPSGTFGEVYRAFVQGLPVRWTSGLEPYLSEGSDAVGL